MKKSSIKIMFEHAIVTLIVSTLPTSLATPGWDQLGVSCTFAH